MVFADFFDQARFVGYLYAARLVLPSRSNKKCSRESTRWQSMTG
jgi:hypothetical protein